MKAIVITAYGGPEVLAVTELPDPVPAAGEVLVRVRAFGLNHAETYMRNGSWGKVAQVPGIECAGTVQADPSGRIAAGTPVIAILGGMGRTRNGSYAELVALPAGNVVPVSTSLSWTDLVALPEVYATAWAGLHQNLRLESGQTVLVRGTITTAARPQPAGTNPLLSPFRLGRLRLANRIVMAPLTRARADEHGVPSPLAAEYYAQRAGAGLIVAEATAVSRQGTGYDNWPGLHTADQEAGWRKITESVHAAGGRIFIQLFHAGRMSHPAFHQGELPVGPSPIAGGPASERYDGVHPFTQPRALRAAELGGIAGQFRAAARRALAAGFDGVEVHAGNGYLIDQFLRDGANQRDDAYGGSAANRARLLREVTAAVISVWGCSRVGVRISPLSPTNGMADSDPVTTFTQAARDLQALGVAYLHVIEPGVNGTLSAPASAQSPRLASGFFRPMFSGAIIAAGGHTASTGGARIQQDQADLIAYGQLFIANPDLPARFRRNAPLAQPQRATFYGGGAAGYTDYPALNLSDAEQHAS